MDSLRQTMGKLEIALGSVQESIVWINPTGSITWCNSRFEQLIGKPRIEFLGTNIVTVFALNQLGIPVQKSNYPTTLSQSKQKPFSAQYEYGRGSAARFFEITCTPFEFQMGEISCMMVVRDISHLIQAEAEQKRIEGLEASQIASLNLLRDLDRKRREVEERERKLKESQAMLVQAGKMSALGQLGAGIAHELNQPLTGILGFAHAMREELEADSQLYADIQTIIDQAERMNTIVNHIRTFAHMDEKTMGEVDVNETLMKAFILIDQQLKNHGIKVVSKLNEKLPRIYGNSHQLQQVFINILVNARDALVDHMETTGENVSAMISVESRSLPDGTVEVLLSNNGPPIPKDIQEKIFEPFFTTKGVQKGTGLGLSITHGIINDFGGTIEVESEEDKGVTFLVKLPVDHRQVPVKAESK